MAAYNRIAVEADSGPTDVWWPTPDAKVTGAQPFKALLRDRNVNDYFMYWQVDGGQMNVMENNYSDYPHKEASVDVTNWNWKGNGPYQITFVSRAKDGSVIASRTFAIYMDRKGSDLPGRNAGSDMQSGAAVEGSPHVAAIWPTNGAHMSGTQTFKAAVTGKSVYDYRMFWQVDGGNPNLMETTTTDGAAKQAQVALDNWQWRGSGPYSVSFFAQDLSGREFSRQTVAIYTDGNSSQPMTTAGVLPVIAANIQNETPAGNPLSGLKFYIDTGSPAKRQADSWRTSKPADAKLMDKIAGQPAAKWLGDWNQNVRTDADAYSRQAEAAGSVPVFIFYNVPGRDCGSYSAGGAGSASGYQSWVKSAADGIGSRKAVVILEPDALAGMDCLSSSSKQERMLLISGAVKTLKAKGNIRVYVDAGNFNWIAAGEMANRLKSAGVAAADGFSLNVSNFFSNSDNVGYGQSVSALIGGKHFVVDSSRNGLGAASGNEWCNPSGRALGIQPTLATNNQLVDAFLWLKTPGESDGNCNGGPSAGTWWPEYALGLASRAQW